MAETDDQRVLAKFATVLADLSREESLTARLCEASRRMLEADGASMTLDYTGPGRLRVHATDPVSASLDDLQDVVGEGPSFDASSSGKVVVARLGEDEDARWSVLSGRVHDMDFSGTVVAVPLLAHRSVLGVLSLHRRGPEQVEDVDTARFLGATVGTALLQDPEIGKPELVPNEAWTSRSQVHQATGMILAQVGVRVEDAMALLRGQAFARNTTLQSVARDIIERRINFRDFTIEGD
jgi:hypothetical protein